MKYKVGKSKIEGDGLFANKALKENELIGLAHLNDEPTEIVGKYHNHSDNPNAYSVKVKNKRFIYALRDLKPGEEITVDYRKQPELEQPEMFKRGGQKKYTRDITATNFLNAEHSLSKKPKPNKKRIYSPTAKYYAEGGEPGKPDPRTQFYTVQGSDGVYRKVNGKWEVDWNRSGKFQPLSKGDIAKRTAILNSQAKPLYDPVYDDLYATQRQQFTPLPVNKPTPGKSTGKIESFDNSIYTSDDEVDGKPVNYVDKNDPSKLYVIFNGYVVQPGRPGGSLIEDKNEIAKIKKNVRVATQFDLDRLPANQIYTSPDELEYIRRATSGEDPYAVRAELKNREAANKAQIFFDNNFELKDENPNEWDPQQKDLMQDVSDKGQQFMKDWQNSPMYWEMLSNSLPGDQSKYMPYYASGRDNQLSILNPLYMTEAYTPDEWSKSTGLTAAAESVGEGRVYIYPKTYSDIPQFALPTHEYSHVADDNGRLIPQKDIDLMRSFLGDPMERKRQFSNYDYDTSNEGRQKIKAQYDYISNPTETRARLNELRFLGKESGIYDPFTQKVTPEIFKQLNNLESSPGYNQPLEDLRDVYTDEQILEMLNTISKNNESNQEFNFAQKGGQQGDRFKKRLMKRYPGMTGVYGDEGENLSIVKDPNYDARSVGYGDIEFQFPEGNPEIRYDNLIEKNGPEYIYPNPSPDKYTALYNPRGANRGDVFLDMMHGMRDDPNYQPLLQNFEKAVRDARGGDMAWYYDKQVKDGYTGGQEQWDANYLDGQLRAQLAPGTIGMFSHGRRDYRKERRHDSPEMRAAAEDIRNYLKGEYENGGELDTYPRGGGPGKGKKGKKVEPYVTSDPKEYEYRKAAYDDSLWLYQNNLRTPPLLKPNKQKYNANDSWFRKLAKWSVDENVIGRKNLTLSPEEFRKGLNTTWKSEGVGRILNQLMGDASDGKSTERQILYTTDEANKHFYSPAYNKYYQIGKPKNNKTGYYSTHKDLPDNEPIKYIGNMYRAKNNTGESGDRISNFEPRYKKPVQPVLFQEPPKPKPKVNQYPKEYKPIVNNIPQTPPEGKAIIGYEEVQQLNPKTGVVTTVKDPIYTDLERPIPTLHPTRVNPELQKFVYPETETEDTDVMPAYDETDIEVGTPDPGGHWEDKYSRYVDWDGNSIAFNGIRFRKPGHGGDLIRKGKKHYIHYPSIEKRYDAWIEPDELPEEEYKDGGEPKGKKKKRDSKGRYRGDKDYIHTPFTEEWKQTYPADEWGQTIQEIPEVYVLGNAERVARDKARVAEEKIARLNYQRYLSAPHMYLPDGSLRQQAAQSADWVWQLGALGAATGLGKSTINAAEALGTRAMPYIEGALNTSLPGMASVPGATVGNALGAMAAVDSGRRLLDVPSQVQKGEYADAAANILTGALDIGTAGMISPLYKGVKATATELNAALKAKNPANFKIPEQWYEKKLYDLYDKGTDSYKLVEIDVPQEVIPARSYDDVKHKLKNLRSDLNISPAEHYLSRIFGRSPIGMSRDRTIADPRDGKLFDSNTRYWLNRLYGNTPSGEEVISKHLLAKDYGKLYKEGLSFEEAQSIMKKYNDPDYKEVSKVLPGSSNGTFAYRNLTPSRVRSTNTGLTEADIQKAIDKNKEWITSAEYARRRAANTGESLEEIQKSVDQIIKAADNATYNLNASAKKMDFYGAEGMMSKKKWWRPAKVEIATDAENPLKTLDHEVKHLYSPSVFNQRKVYKNYPTINADEHYLTIGPEQQVRHLAAREQILEKNNLPIDAQLTDEQVSEFVDKWRSKMNKRKKNPNDFSLHEDYDDLWSEQAGLIQKEMLKSKYNTEDLNFISTLPTTQKIKFMNAYKDRLNSVIKSALNNAWMTVPVAGGVEMMNSGTPEQRYGGSIGKLKKFIR